jgi:hypothetical protein
MLDEVGKILAQLVDVDTTGAEHRNGIFVFRQSQQKVFQGRVLMPPLGGKGQCAMQTLFQITR